MAFVKARQITEELKESYICVNSYKNKQMQGCFWNGSFPRAIQFDNLMQLLLLIDQTLTEMEFPKPYTKRRSFTKKTIQLSGLENTSDDLRPPRGNLATFRIKILFQQNASWQGSITWLEDNNEESFRSTLEMVMLMDSALAEQNAEMSAG